MPIKEINKVNDISESNESNILNGAIDHTKDYSHIVLSDENKIKQTKILSCIKRKKFKEIKNILNCSSSSNINDIFTLITKDIEFEINESFENNNFMFYQIYINLKDYINLDNIIIKYTDNILKLYRESILAKQEKRIETFKNTFGHIIDFESQNKEKVLISDEQKNEIVELIIESDINIFGDEIISLTSSIGGIENCLEIILEEIDFLEEGRKTRILPLLEEIKKIALIENRDYIKIIDKKIEKYAKILSTIELIIDELKRNYNKKERIKLFSLLLKKLNNNYNGNNNGDSILTLCKNKDEISNILNNINKNILLYILSEFFQYIGSPSETTRQLGFSNYSESNKENTEKLKEIFISKGIDKKDIKFYDYETDENLIYKNKPILLDSALSVETSFIYDLIKYKNIIIEINKHIPITTIMDIYNENKDDISILKKYIFNDETSTIHIKKELNDLIYESDNIGNEDIEEHILYINKIFNFLSGGKYELTDYIIKNIDIQIGINYYLKLNYNYNSDEIIKLLAFQKGISIDKMKLHIANLIKNYGDYMIRSGDNSEKLNKLNEEDYLILNYAIYKNGEYSSHRKNIDSNKSQLNHLEKYNFKKEGYPIILNGINGYELKDGEIENTVLLNNYSKRIEKISTLGKEGKLNSQSFNEILDKKFQKLSIKGFLEIKNLPIEEKIICLLVDEIKKSQNDGNYEINTDTLDTIIIYKYSNNSNISEYINQTRDDIKNEESNINKNRLLWYELSNIYGEELKDTLRNKIFNNNKLKNYNKIISIYLKEIGIKSEDKKLKENQLSRIENTFNNTNIPENKKYEVLKKQIINIFGSGILIDNEEKENFKKEIEIILKTIENNFTFENFKKIISKLFNIREKYKNKINKRLESLFTKDINNIFEEINKYKEIIEVEDKQIDMGGSTSGQIKKTSKKRNITGYFTKTRESSNARMGAYLCISSNTDMWKNENYFELILKNEETKQCEGLVMLLNIEADNGKKFLWFGPNPNQSFLEKISSKKCYNYLYETVCNFAKENNFDGVVVPSSDDKIVGECTNRGGDFPNYIKKSKIKDKDGNNIIVNFGKKHYLGGKDSYGYSDGSLIWKN